MNEWKPIETAPRDGTPFLGWNRYDGVLVYKSCRFGSNKQFEGWEAALDYQDVAEYPTRWMPLPDPPVST